jgi:hypothetical protein
MGEVMIPPWVRPESPETIRWIDDATQAFQPAFGRGTTQRGIWADPRWGLRRRYRGLRSDEKAAILNALNDTRGQLNILRVTPHAPLRGSMPTGELLANNTFVNGTTGWSGTNGATIAVSDRILRVTRGDSQANYQVTQSGVTVPALAPCVLRAMYSPGRGGSTFRSLISDGTVSVDANSRTGGGMLANVLTPQGSTASVSFYEASTSGAFGDYFQVPYVSFSRCALVDGQNRLLRSDEFDHASWTKTRSTVSANFLASPDGTTTADAIIEDSTAADTHFVNQDITISSGIADYAFSVALRAGTRTWAAISLVEATGSTAVTVFVNLTTGALGTGSTGGNWADRRAFIQPLGDSWHQVSLVARKTNAATTLRARVYIAESDNDFTFSGDGASYISAWRATVAQSSVPTRLLQTTSTAITSEAQTGSALHTKGWPASTNGLLLAGDWFEINGELKQLTAPVNSDAAGLAYMQFRPTLASSPADNDPIIIHEPFGRFIYPQGTRELENLFGIYGDCEMNLEEVYV